MENKNNNEIIDRVKLLMGYKLSMTLNENLSVILEQPESRGVSQETKDVLKRGGEQLRQQELEKEKEEPGKPKEKYIWPIPGYTTYYTPTPNSEKGGQSYMYFPLGIKDSVQLWNFATPSDFPELKKRAKYGFETATHFQKILPFGTVRNFNINGQQYLTKLSRPNKVWVFKGYYSGEKPYVSPDPEQYKSEWDKFLEKYKDAFQIIASVLAAIIIEIATAGTGTAFAVKLILEVAAELLINVPVSIFERKMGDDAAANLSLIFSFLPFLDVKFLRIGGVSKEISQKISKELLDSGITDAAGLAKFYDNLSTDSEKYLFSRVLQQRPEDIEKSFGGLFKQVFSDPETNKKIFTKLAFKDKIWWKTAGLQLSTAMTLCFMKTMFSTNYSEEQYNRMNDFMVNFFEKVGDEKGQKIIQKTLEIPKAQDSLVKIVMSDTSNLKETKKLVKEYLSQVSPYSEDENKILHAILDSIKIERKQKNNIDIDPTMINN